MDKPVMHITGPTFPQSIASHGDKAMDEAVMDKRAKSKFDGWCKMSGEPVVIEWKLR